MASKSSSPVTTLYQCSECKYCSQNLEEATLHAVQVHGEVEDDYQEESEEELSKIEVKEDKELVLSDEECSSISFYKQTNGSVDGKEGNQRKSDWSSEATKLLIESVHENYSNLKYKKVKKKIVWERIHSCLEDRVPDLTPVKCEQKWKSLLAAQKRYSLNLNKSFGKSKLKKPEFYEEVSEVIGENLAEVNIDEEGDSSESYNTKASENKGKRIVNSFSFQSDDLNPESLLDTLGQSNLQGGSDTVHLLSRLVGALERREAANERFQREILEIEKEKLRCVQRFIEGREKFNTKRYQMMKEWMIFQSRAKRKREEED